jgi:hypothetical protein
MKKIILTSMILVVSSLTVGCSKEEYIKEKDIINITSNTKKLVSKEVKLPIYFLDKNIRKVKYLSIDDNLSIEEKIEIISNTISTICFNDLPIDIDIDEKKVNVNLVESKESHKSWKNDFLDENNLEETTLLLVKNLLQEDYKGEWINTVHITYEGEDIN